MIRRADVIVIGGGIAGLVAARELRLAGLQCTVLEARPRIGGRIWTRRTFGEARDIGATCVHWIQPHVWAELTRYGLGVKDRSAPDMAVALAGDQRIETNPSELWKLIEAGMDEFCADSRQIFPVPYGEPLGPELLSVDGQSVTDRIARLDVSGEIRMIIEAFWTLHCNAAGRDTALTHALRWVSAAGGDWRLFSDARTRYCLPHGLGGLADAIYAHGRPALMLGDPARLVERTDREVVVVTDSGFEFEARACILALPLNVLAELEIRPGLSPANHAAVSGGSPAAGFMLWARTERPLTASYLCLASGGAPVTSCQTADTCPSGTVLSLVGPDNTAFDLESVAAVEEIVQRWIPELRLSEVWSHDWSRDEFSRETWHVARPGQLTRDAGEYRRADGNLFLAGADVATGPWNGLVDGAIESGLHAAREAVFAVTRPDSSRHP